MDFSTEVRNFVIVYKFMFIQYSFFILFCSIVKLLPLGTVDDLMHYCTRPKARCNNASGHPQN